MHYSTWNSLDAHRAKDTCGPAVLAVAAGTAIWRRPPVSDMMSTMSSQEKGYWLVTAVVTDPTGFQGYTSVAGPLIAAAGGRVLARGDEFEVAEGSSPGRPFVIEFPSYVAAKECFESDGYQAAIKLREGHATFDIVIAQGFTPPAAPTS